MLLVTGTDITVWIVSVLLALGIGASKYAKWKARNRLVRELAAMDRERREKVLSRMNPGQAMEARQELMRRFNIFRTGRLTFERVLVILSPAKNL